MIDVFGRGKHFEVQARPTLAPDIDCVALIEIDSPRRRFGLPTEPVKFHRELRRGSLWIVAAQTLNRRRVSISDRDDSRLSRFQINLKSKLVILIVAIEIVCL